MRKDGQARLNLLEWYGLQYLRRLNPREVWAVHRLAPEELLHLQRTERRAIFSAALAGTLSGTVLGISEMLIGSRYADGLQLALWREQLPYWGVFGTLVLIVSAAEMIFLHWNAVRSAGNVSDTAGLRLAKDDQGTLIARGLVRAALELPNPQTQICGIDPYARTARWRLVALAGLYRLKVGATSFILRIFLRRILARTALRALIPLIGIPVYAVWNAAVTMWVLRHARVRSFGPLAVSDLGELINSGPERLRPETRRLILRSVSEVIVRSADAHPNFILLVNYLLKELETAPRDLRPNWEADRELLKALDERQQRAVLQAIATAVVIDGRIEKHELALLADAYRTCGRPFQPEAVHRLRTLFMDGQGISKNALGGLSRSYAEA